MSNELSKSFNPSLQKFDPSSERRTLKRALSHSNSLMHFRNLDFFPFPEVGFINTEFAFNSKQFFESNQANENGEILVRYDFENKGSWDTDFIAVPVVYHKFSSGGRKSVKMQAKRGEMVSEIVTKEIYVKEGLRIGESFLKEIAFSGRHQSIVMLSSNRIKVLGIESGDTLLIGGYEEDITTMKLTADGQFIVTGSVNGVVKKWDVVTGECVRIIHAHQKEISVLQLGDHSSLLMTYGSDGMLGCWDLDSGENKWMQHLSREFVKSIAIHPDEAEFAIGTVLKTVIVGSVATGVLSDKFAFENSWIEKIVYSPDGVLLATVRNGNEGKIINVKTSSTFIRIGDGCHIQSLRISNNGTHALACTSEHTVRVWDLKTGDPISSFYSSDDWVFDDPFDKHSKLIATRGFDNSIKLYNTESGGCFAIFLMSEGYVKSSEFHPTESRVIVGGNDNKLRLWDLKTGDVLSSYDSNYQWPKTTAFNHDGSLLAFTVSERDIQLWKPETVEFIKEISMFEDKVKQVLFNTQGNRLFIRGEKTISIYDLQTERFLQSFEGNTKIIKTAVLSPDGQSIISSGADYSIKSWDISTGNIQREFKGLTGVAQQIFISPNNRYIIAKSDFGQLCIWDFASEKLLWQIADANRKVGSFALSEDQLMLATSIRNEVYLWATLTGNSLGLVGKHNESITSLLFHHGENLLFSGALDNSTKIWRISDFANLRTIKGGTNLKLSPDGRYLMNGFGGEIRIWDIFHELRIGQ